MHKATGLLLAAGLALAAEKTGAECPPHPLRTAFATPSMAAWREGPIWHGYLIDLYKLLSVRSGCAITLTEQTHTRTAQRHAYDVLGNVGLPPKLTAEQAEVNVPLHREYMHLITAPAFGDLDSSRVLIAASLRLGTIENARYGEDIDALIAQVPAAQRVSVNTLEELYNGFNASRINVTFANQHVHRWFLRNKQHGRDYFAKPMPQLPPITVGVHVRRQDLTEAQFQHVRAALISLRDDGTYRAIMEKHMGRDLVQMMQFDVR